MILVSNSVTKGTVYLVIEKAGCIVEKETLNIVTKTIYDSGFFTPRKYAVQM
jgi:hypothetical protein